MHQAILRRALPEDVPAMATLIREQAARGRMLPRSAGELRAALPGFRVAVTGEARLLACGGLRSYAAHSAEVIGLAVRDDCHGLGLGRRLVEALTRDARRRGLDRVYALTLEPAFFERMGFHRSGFERIPEKVARDCLACPFRSRCREIPVVRVLHAAGVGVPAGVPHSRDRAPAVAATPQVSGPAAVPGGALRTEHRATAPVGTLQAPDGLAVARGTRVTTGSASAPATPATPLRASC